MLGLMKLGANRISELSDLILPGLLIVPQEDQFPRGSTLGGSGSYQPSRQLGVWILTNQMGQDQGGPEGPSLTAWRLR
jgi:hypothetical protein